jgi:hypothetical protein
MPRFVYIPLGRLNRRQIKRLSHSPSALNQPEQSHNHRSSHLLPPISALPLVPNSTGPITLTKDCRIFGKLKRATEYRKELAGVQRYWSAGKIACRLSVFQKLSQSARAQKAASKRLIDSFFTSCLGLSCAPIALAESQSLRHLCTSAVHSPWSLDNRQRAAGVARRPLANR